MTPVEWWLIEFIGKKLADLVDVIKNPLGLSDMINQLAGGNLLHFERYNLLWVFLWMVYAVVMTVVFIAFLRNESVTFLYLNYALVALLDGACLIMTYFQKKGQK